jgi:hypothetical protein
MDAAPGQCAQWQHSFPHGQDGVLRYQHDQRQAKGFDYIQLNGSLVAKRAVDIAPAAIGRNGSGLQRGRCVCGAVDSRCLRSVTRCRSRVAVTGRLSIKGLR